MPHFQILSGRGHRISRRGHYEQQVRVVRLEAELGDHAMDLAAVVGLMVEHMRDKDPFRAFDLHLRCARMPCQLTVEPVWVKRLGPSQNHLVESFTRVLEILLIWSVRDRCL